LVAIFPKGTSKDNYSSIGNISSSDSWRIGDAGDWSAADIFDGSGSSGSVSEVSTPIP